MDVFLKREGKRKGSITFSLHCTWRTAWTLGSSLSSTSEAANCGQNDEAVHQPEVVWWGVHIILCYPNKRINICGSRFEYWWRKHRKYYCCICLLRKFEKKSTSKAAMYVECLSHMKVNGRFSLPIGWKSRIVVPCLKFLTAHLHCSACWKCLSARVCHCYRRRKCTR